MTMEEESFLCFRMEEMYFILPVGEVSRILSGERHSQDESSLFRADACGKIPILDFRRNHTDGQSYSSIIVLQDKELFGIAVDAVEGLIRIEPDSQYEFPERIRDEKNSFISGLSYWPEKRKLLYLLDAVQLGQYIGR